MQSTFRSWVMAILSVGALLRAPVRGWAQAPPPVPGVAAMLEVSGAKGFPDPTITYKFVLDLTSVSPGPDAVNPGFIAVARLVNTFARYGVDAEHRRFVVVFHDTATEFVVQDATYRQRNGGHANPNRAMMDSLLKAGVQFVVGGESVQARNIDPATLLSGVQMNLSTTLTFLDLETRGYVFSSTSKL